MLLLPCSQMLGLHLNNHLYRLVHHLMETQQVLLTNFELVDLLDLVDQLYMGMGNYLESLPHLHPMGKYSIEVYHPYER